MSLQKSFKDDRNEFVSFRIRSVTLLRRTADQRGQRWCSVGNCRSALAVLIVGSDRLRIEVNRDGLGTCPDTQLDPWDARHSEHRVYSDRIDLRIGFRRKRPNRFVRRFENIGETTRRSFRRSVDPQWDRPNNWEEQTIGVDRWTSMIDLQTTDFLLRQRLERNEEIGHVRRTKRKTIRNHLRLDQRHRR